MTHKGGYNIAVIARGKIKYDHTEKQNTTGEHFQARSFTPIHPPVSCFSSSAVVQPAMVEETCWGAGRDMILGCLRPRLLPACHCLGFLTLASIWSPVLRRLARARVDDLVCVYLVTEELRLYQDLYHLVNHMSGN